MTTDKPMTMVERVARAIYELDQIDVTGPAVKFEDIREQAVRDAYRFTARAAIEAMREPTQRMLDATLTDASAFTWRTMIDAALNEDQGK